MKTLNINNIDENRLNTLVTILKRLNTEEMTDELRSSAKDVVKTINPVELSIAEQKLIDDGLDPKELKHLCEIHMEILKDELIRLEQNVAEGHVLHTLVKEHEVISSFLDRLEELNKEFQSLTEYNVDMANEVRDLGEKLLEAEPHHKREEDALFPVLESKGITGPTRIMKLEHEQLRILKRDLKALGENYKYISLDDFKERLNKISTELVFELREHIVKENYILYPTALDSVSPKEFDDMKIKCDEMGYCTFTPIH